MKKYKGKEDVMRTCVSHIRLMNYMKMYGLGLTREGYLIVRDHISRGEPFIFWRHKLCKTSYDEDVLKVNIGDGDGIGWALKISGRIDIEDDPGKDPDSLGLVSTTCNVYKECVER